MSKIVILPCFRELLERIDIFGLAVTFRIFSKKNHKTQFGGFITLVIFSIIVYQFILLLQQLFSQISPSVIQQQNYVNQPEPFYISPSTLSFAFGLQDSLGNNFKDERIYKVKSIMQTNSRVYNQQTGTFDLQISQREVSLVSCTPDHFQVSGTEDYFSKLPIDRLYCFGLNETQLWVEGEFSALKFAQLNLQILECVGDGCLNQTERQDWLFNPKLGIYTSDYIVQLTDHAMPYQAVGKNLYWVTGLNFIKEVRYNLINNYIHTDDGLIGSNDRVDRVVSYSSDREQVLDRNSALIFNFYFDYEKNKENVYYRRYMKFDTILSQIGGTFNILVGIGYLLCWPISQLDLNRKIINSVFSLNDTEINSSSNLSELKEKEEKDQHSQIHQKLKKYKQNLKPTEKSDNFWLTQEIEKESSNCQSNQFNHSNQFHKLNKLDQSDKGYSKNQTISENEKKINSSNSQYSDQIKKIFSLPFEQIKLKFKDYIMSYFRETSKKSRMIRQGTDILYSHIDIFNIVNKLIELEKLKHLLLNEDQLKLFDYLPKPSLKLPPKQTEIPFNSSQQNNKLGLSLKSIPDPFDNQQIVNSKQKLRQKKVFGDDGFFFTAQKSSKVKAEEAYLAFMKIICTPSRDKSEINKKLIQMIDPQLLIYFKENLNSSIFQSIQTSPLFSIIQDGTVQGAKRLRRSTKSTKFSKQDISYISEHKQVKAKSYQSNTKSDEEDTINPLYNTKVKLQGGAASCLFEISSLSQFKQ